MTEKGVNLAEPGDVESLDLATIHVHSWNEIEYVRIGIIPEDAAGPDGTISFAMVQFPEGYKGGCKSLQANLTRAEIDIVIEGLQEARKRMG